MPKAPRTDILDPPRHPSFGIRRDDAGRVRPLAIRDFAAMNKVYGTYFGANPPARATVQVARLPKDVAIEISAIATK